MKKTFKQWVKQDKDLDDFLSPGDYIDERLYNYIGEIIPPAYYSRDFIPVSYTHLRAHET